MGMIRATANNWYVAVVVVGTALCAAYDAAFGVPRSKILVEAAVCAVSCVLVGAAQRFDQVVAAGQPPREGR